MRRGLRKGCGIVDIVEIVETYRPIVSEIVMVLDIFK